MKISVILPIYNEVDNVEPLFEQITQALDGYNYEIVAVDDGSNDGTQDKLKACWHKIPQLKVVYFRRNCGQTAAFDAGFRHCASDSTVVVTMDADLQNDPADIPKLVEELNKGYDLVCGWRKDRKDGMFLRKIPSRIANYIIRKVTKTSIHDLGCSLKVFRKEITDEINLYGEMHRFLAPIAESVGARVSEMVVHHRPRIAGVSKYGLKRTFKVVLDLLTVWFMRRFQSKPIYFFGGTGFLLCGAGSLLLTMVAYQKWALDIFVHKNPYFMLGFIFILIGTQFILTGLIAEILVRTYFESRNKTPYHVKTVLTHTDPTSPTLSESTQNI